MTSLFVEGGASWPPSPQNYYLASGASRPVMQGDIFADVPFVKAKRGNKITDRPNITIERRDVAVMGYPCDVYANGRLVKVQTVSPVVDAERAGIPQDWAGAYTVAPLPDLHGDGRMWAVDLRVSANIDAFYLDRANRRRSLSEVGWAILRQRIGLSSGRVLAHLNDFIGAGRDVWDEMALWQFWNDKGLPESGYQSWLDEPDPNLSGFSRRDALYRGMSESVKSSIEAETG